jgi:tRNA pseudouridine55 synthase
MAPRGGGDGPDGLALVDKGPGWTSHDVVAKARGILGTRKVGHSGTLDPDATGLLLLGVGRVTRLLRFLNLGPKRYTGIVVLGTATSTLDASGEVTGTWDMSAVARDAVEAAARELTGDQLQVPPMVSAVHVDGRRLHELAREGKEVDRDPRPVTVHELTVGGEVAPGEYAIEVACSAGTYVRSLAADLGEALGGGAHLRNLRRTAIGSFRVEDAVPVEALAAAHLRPPADALRDVEAVTVDEDLAVQVGHGRKLTTAVLGAGGPGPWAVLDRAGSLLAVYERHRDGAAKPAVVLAGPPQP